jgi:hypothetical protein
MQLNTAIVHITDLHFPPGGRRPPWTEPMLKAFNTLRTRHRCSIFALAVTGDVVDTPDAPPLLALREAKSFLCDAAKALGIVRDGHADQGRIWSSTAIMITGPLGGYAAVSREA